MPVSTDGVMLGAWMESPSPAHILDIGTGTGLLALMCAQRFPDAKLPPLTSKPQRLKPQATIFRTRRGTTDSQFSIPMF